MNKPVPTDRQSRPAFLGDLLDTLTERGRNLLRRREPEAPVAAPDLATLGDLLLSRRGEASGVALARALVAAFDAAAPEERRGFLALLAERFGPDRAAVEAAIAAIEARRARRDRDACTPPPSRGGRSCSAASTSRPGGTAALVRMREELLKHLREQPELRRLDSDFAHLFGSWFNRGFLVLRHIDWTTPANILEKIIRYEAVHAIQQLGRPPQPARADRPALLRLLPPAAGRRAADLRRGGADRGDPRQRRRPPRPRPRADRGGEGDDRGVLLDLQHPEGPRRRLVRQLPDQAGGRGPEGASCRT